MAGRTRKAQYRCRENPPAKRAELIAAKTSRESTWPAGQPAESDTRALPGFAYRADYLGRVWSVARKGRPRQVWRRLRTSITYGPGIYEYVMFCKDGKRYRRTVHTLVLEAWCGECPPGQEACHGDGDSLHNQISNLRWDTPEANRRDGVAHGTSGRGETNRNARLSDAAVLDIRARYVPRVVTNARLAAEYGVATSTAQAITARRRWRHLP